MPSRFDALGERLLRAGIAPRHARRYLDELADHLADLVEEERGRSDGQAEARALGRLGEVEALAGAMTAGGRFRSWSARAPLAAYVLAPPVALALSFVGAMALIVAVAGVSHAAVAGVAGPLVLVTAFVMPVLLGWSLALAAVRQRARPLWPLLGMAAVAVLGALARLQVTLPSPGGHGEIDIAFSGVGPALAQAAASLALICLPYAVAARRRGLVPTRPFEESAT